MNRMISLGVVVITLILPLTSQAPPITPALTVSLYAPAQKHAPLHIVRFTYDMGGIGLVLRNDSNKTVTGVSVNGIVSLPSGCEVPEAEETHIRHTSLPSSKISLHIAPRSTSMTPKEDPPFNPAGLVMAAQSEKYAFLHVQVQIVEVDFAQGPHWPASDQEAQGFDGGIDSTLVSADQGSCEHNKTGVLDALADVSAIAFSIDSRAILNKSGTQKSNSVPHLTFSCFLNDKRATCPFE